MINPEKTTANQKQQKHTNTTATNKDNNNNKRERGTLNSNRLSSMKEIYPKVGNGKFHPSPTRTTDAVAVLTLLPAAILTLTTILTYEDKQVLAYLITRSLSGPFCSSHDENRRYMKSQAGRTTTGGVPHPPMFECGCFECYTNFWIRWDSSPDRELIHQVIEAFEEHLANSEKAGNSGRRRDRNKKKKKKRERDERKEEDVVLVVDEEGEKVEVEEEWDVVVEKKIVADEILGKSRDGSGGGEGGGVERWRSWPDVMGIFNSRFWNLWSPGV